MEYTDQTGNKIQLDKVPSRIISVVPSQTELLFDLGLNVEVIGITKFCVHPEKWFRTKQRIGGTKKLNIEKIRELNPELIIANKEENERKDIETLMERFPVWISDIKNLNDALQMIEQVGEITNKKTKANEINEKTRNQFADLKIENKLDCIYLIWNDPIMTVGGDTFINDMLERSGFNNLAGDLPRYPELTPELLIELNPEVLLLSSEPFPFGQKHMDYFSSILPLSRLYLVDGEYFSWYGSRLQFSPDYFSKLRRKIENAS